MFRNNIQQNKEVTEKEIIELFYNILHDESLISKEIIYILINIMELVIV